MYPDTSPYSLVLCAVSNLEYNATALNYNSRTKRVTNLAFPITHLPSIFNHIANRLTTASFPSPSGKQFVVESWNRERGDGLHDGYSGRSNGGGEYSPVDKSMQLKRLVDGQRLGDR